jgi:hypothetical protein
MEIKEQENYESFKADRENDEKPETLSILREIWSKYKNNTQFPPNLFYDLQVRYNRLRKKLDLYLFDEKKKGLAKALNDKEYPEYYDDLQNLIDQEVGSYLIVNRTEGYRGDGRGVGEYVSISYNYYWGRDKIEQGHSKVFLVKREDVVAAGTGGEDELIIKRDGLIDITDKVQKLIQNEQIEKQQTDKNQKVDEDNLDKLRSQLEQPKETKNEDEQQCLLKVKNTIDIKLGHLLAYIDSKNLDKSAKATQIILSYSREKIGYKKYLADLLEEKARLDSSFLKFTKAKYIKTIQKLLDSEDVFKKNDEISKKKNNLKKQKNKIFQKDT